MNQETLDRASSISHQLSLLHDQRKNWAAAKNLTEGTFAYIEGYAGQQCLKTEHIPFDTVKALTLSVIDQKIDKLQKEFSSL